MLPNVLLMRLNKELADLERDPPPGIMCFPVDDDITHLEAYIKGPPDSPYEKGTFRLEIHVPLDYPFNPPQIRFKTMIYHPNIDDAGRICADILKKGEHGGWKPSLNLSTTLISLSALMGNPNPDDPLDAEIAHIYQVDINRFMSNARELTLKYATGEQAKKDTTMQKQESKPGLSGVEALDNLERNASRPKQKSKLSLSTKKRKSESPSVMDSSTPSSSQLPGKGMDILEVKSNASPEIAKSTACDGDKSDVLEEKNGVPSSNTDSAAYGDVKPIALRMNSDAPSDRAEHVGNDNSPIEDTEVSEVKNSVSSENIEGAVCKVEPVEAMDVLNIESSTSSVNEDNAACNDIKPIPHQEKSPAKLSGTPASSPVQRLSSQPLGLSERSSQKVNGQRLASIRSIDTVDSMAAGKENIDDMTGSQKSIQSVEQERCTPLKLAKNVNTKELVKEVKKDKGKAVYKPRLAQAQDSYSASDEPRSNPSEYMVGCGWRSSFDNFSFEDTIDLTSDNDFIPKKRTIDTNKRNKLSLSKSKRQKSQNNASQA